MSGRNLFMVLGGAQDDLVTASRLTRPDPSAMAPPGFIIVRSYTRTVGGKPSTPIYTDEGLARVASGAGVKTTAAAEFFRLQTEFMHDVGLAGLQG